MTAPDEPSRGPEAKAEAETPWAESLVRLLDDGWRVPGTRLTFGLDPILGFFLPAAGDAITGLGSASLLLLAIRERVPTVALARMVVNILVDVIVGSLPFVGDVFDAFWKSNRRNLSLIERYRDDPAARPSVMDYVLVSIALVLIALGVLLPYLLLVALGALVLQE